LKVIKVAIITDVTAMEQYWTKGNVNKTQTIICIKNETNETNWGKMPFLSLE
jgi:hypothetical protein